MVGLECADLAEMGTGRHVSQSESGDVSPHSKEKSPGLVWGFGLNRIRLLVTTAEDQRSGRPWGILIQWILNLQTELSCGFKVPLIGRRQCVSVVDCSGGDQ